MSSSDEVACPRCKTTKYRNPSLRLMVNVCGHALCDSCVELLFVKGSAVCAECGISLRRANFRAQLFEDAHVEREVDIRKRILRDYNKREENFGTLREYNDYLEEIEEVIFNLTNDVDVENTKRRVEQYRRDNRAIIARNKCKPRTRDEELLDDLIDFEQQESAYRQNKVLEEHREEAKIKTKNKEALLDELIYSDAPAGEIMAIHAAEQLLRKPAAAVSEAPSEQSQVQSSLSFAAKEHPSSRTGAANRHQAKFSSGIKFWRAADAFQPLSKPEEDSEFVAYKYDEIAKDLCGPQPPLYDDLTKNGYLENTKKNNEQERAAGYLPNISCYRALEEALCGLYHFGGGGGVVVGFDDNTDATFSAASLDQSTQETSMDAL